MSWPIRLYRLVRWMFRFHEPRLPREVDARLRQFETERRIRMNRYAATWRRKWAEQGIALDRRSQMRRVR